MTICNFNKLTFAREAKLRTSERDIYVKIY